MVQLFVRNAAKRKTGTPDTNTVTNTDAQRQLWCNFLSEMLQRKTGTPASQDTNTITYTDTNTIIDADIDANTGANTEAQKDTNAGTNQPIVYRH